MRLEIRVRLTQSQMNRAHRMPNTIQTRVHSEAPNATLEAYSLSDQRFTASFALSEGDLAESGFRSLAGGLVSEAAFGGASLELSDSDGDPLFTAKVNQTEARGETFTYFKRQRSEWNTGPGAPKRP